MLCYLFNIDILRSQWLGRWIVTFHEGTAEVLTVASGIFFTRFSTDECILTKCSFLLMSLIVEAINKRESAALSVFYL